MHKRMLANQIMMGQRGRLGQAGGATTVQAGGGSRAGDALVVEALPVRLAAAQELAPAGEAGREGPLLRAQHVEEPDAALGDGAGAGGGAHGGQHLGLGEEELGARGPDVVGQLEGRVGGVRAGEDAAGGDDAEEDHGVLDLEGGEEGRGLWSARCFHGDDGGDDDIGGGGGRGQ